MTDVVALREADAVVIGSGSAAAAAALTASVAGLSVWILEKSDRLGGTSAMSGAGTWIPANHHAQAAGIEDSPEEALTYLRATGPAGWRETEDGLWRALAADAPEMLRFIEAHTPLRFALTNEPDPYADAPGGKAVGRMLSPRPLSRRILGPYAAKLRRSTLPHLFTYQETLEADPYHHPVRAVLKLWPRLLWRKLTASRGQGNALMAGLLKGCLDHGCRLSLSTRALKLLTDESGRVTGVLAEQEGRRITFAAARGVVLATGGFEWDKDLLARHFPGPAGRLSSPRSNEGDGQRMAEAIGAKLDRMDQANIYASLPTRYDGQRHGMPATFHVDPHAILVNRQGQRFTSEYAFNVGEALDQRAPDGSPLHLPTWVIADARFLRRSPAFRWYARKDPGWVLRADSIEELARRIAVPPDALKATVERYNAFCAKGLDEDFHRGEDTWERYKAGSTGAENRALGTIAQPPFVALAFDRPVLGTKGGARTNERCQVLRPDGSVIAGLYCAGIGMASPIGTRAVGAGTTIGPNMTWGYIAANTIIRQNQ